MHRLSIFRNCNIIGHQPARTSQLPMVPCMQEGWRSTTKTTPCVRRMRATWTKPSKSRCWALGSNLVWSSGWQFWQFTCLLVLWLPTPQQESMSVPLRLPALDPSLSWLTSGELLRGKRVSGLSCFGFMKRRDGKIVELSGFREDRSKVRNPTAQRQHQATHKEGGV